MNIVPTKVVAIIGAEAGIFIGLGILLYHSVIVVITATKNKAWQGFRSL